MVFELQLSTTFISVIVAREQFYERNNTFVIWVLIDFDRKRFTDLDIAYGNNANVFVLNEKAKLKTLETGELWFEVYWQEPRIEANQIEYEWKSVLMPFSALTFHDYYLKAFYKDVDQIEGELKSRLTLSQLESKDCCPQCKSNADRIVIDGKSRCSSCLTVY